MTFFYSANFEPSAKRDIGIAIIIFLSISVSFGGSTAAKTNTQITREISNLEVQRISNAPGNSSITVTPGEVIGVYLNEPIQVQTREVSYLEIVVNSVDSDSIKGHLPGKPNLDAFIFDIQNEIINNITVFGYYQQPYRTSSSGNEAAIIFAQAFPYFLILLLAL